MSTESTTWDVWERRVLMNSHTGVIVQEKPIAICATQAQALAELSRIAKSYANEAQYMGGNELPAFLIKPGTLLVGFTVLDGGKSE